MSEKLEFISDFKLYISNIQYIYLRNDEKFGFGDVLIKLT